MTRLKSFSAAENMATTIEKKAKNNPHPAEDSLLLKIQSGVQQQLRGASAVCVCVCVAMQPSGWFPHTICWSSPSALGPVKPQYRTRCSGWRPEPGPCQGLITSTRSPFPTHSRPLGGHTGPRAGPKLNSRSAHFFAHN